MSRYFTLQQAERLLPEVETAVRQAIALKSQHQDAELELRAEMHRVSMLGGVDLSRGTMLEKRALRDETALKLKKLIDSIHELGCLVKDLDIGLIDFPTLFHGEEVYLCWKLGERGIAYWHGVTEGFRGRKPIDQDFVDNHKGDEPN